MALRTARGVLCRSGTSSSGLARRGGGGGGGGRCHPPSSSSSSMIRPLDRTSAPASWCACQEQGRQMSTRTIPIPAINVPITEMVRRQQQSQSRATTNMTPSTSSSRSSSTPSSISTKKNHRFQSALAAAAELSQSTGDTPHHSSSTTNSSSSSPPPHSSSIPAEVDPQFVNQVGIDKDQLVALASQKPTPLRLADMYKYGRNSADLKQRLLNAQFLHREMPIRIAQRAVDLLTLPHGLSESQPIRQVAGVYLEYLQKLQSIPCPKTQQEEHAFTDLLQSFVLDRTSVPISIARGVSAWREQQSQQSTKQVDGEDDELSARRLQEMEEALYRFFTARVGLRFLTEHHVLSSQRPECQELRKVTHMFQDNIHTSKNSTSDLGCIQSDCNLVDETRKVADLVMKQTTECYGLCPAIEIFDCQHLQNDQFTYATHHLHYMLAELLKNSCRATVQQYLQGDSHSIDGDDASTENSTHLPKLHPIRVIITKGEEDVTIKIADRGGGIPRSLMNHIWKFGHSHSDEHEFKTEFGTVEGTGAHIRGFGLPLARIYARYFGGELNLKSMEGYGVDSYLHLPRLGSSCENLPLRVRASPGERDSTPGRQIRNYSTINNVLARDVSSRALARGNSSNAQSRMWTEQEPADPSARQILDALAQRAL